MNLYIFENVLSDYTDGMAVIAAESLDRAHDLVKQTWSADWLQEEFAAAIANGTYKVLAVQYQEEGVISYVFGGG